MYLAATKGLFAQRLDVTDLNKGNGYTIIQLGDVQLIENYTKIIHIFDTTNIIIMLRI